MVPIWKYFGLQRQECAARIHQINAGQQVLQRDLLGTEVLFNGDGKVGAPFHRGVVCHDHHLFAVNAPYAGDDSPAWALVFIHPPSGQGAELQEWGAWVQELLNPLSDHQLASTAVKLDRIRVLPLPDLCEVVRQLSD